MGLYDSVRSSFCETAMIMTHGNDYTTISTELFQNYDFNQMFACPALKLPSVQFNKIQYYLTFKIRTLKITIAEELFS